MGLRERQRSWWPTLIALGTGSALLLTNPSIACAGLVVAAFVLGIRFSTAPLRVGVALVLPAAVAAIVVGAFDSVGLLALALVAVPFGIAFSIAFAVLGSMVGQRLGQRDARPTTWDGPRIRATIAMVVATVVVIIVPFVVTRAFG